ncbi:serine hydrolase domain-containing protein [Flagellimonas flava]|uniref:Beta-lactamase n=1 Tax=Flagellimonas flava TaxID=570519 RepID=A0A1M5ICP0_9FLAO|nr:serine hydrolase domain-containing protein [Allomuricauda flava]SHG26031.1 Beta-lactamase [Allomuricauda flava]
MKRLSIKIYIVWIAVMFNNALAQDFMVHPCESVQPIGGFVRAEALDEAMGKLVRNGVPGAAIAVFSDNGWWYTAKGFSRIEDKTPLRICNLQYLQSVAKTYHAVAILKLHEQGKIDLDKPITDYLPKNISGYISEAGKISVKMLLNHTSGIPEYNFNPNYVARLLQTPEYAFTGEDYLGYIRKKPLDFEPGSRYSYRNTNYVLLALILDQITGDHAQCIDDIIFKPLGLSSTFYRNDANFLNYQELVNSYWDRNSTGIVENATYLQRKNVQHMIGDDGIVTTPVEAVKFLKGLMEGQLLSKKTLGLMKQWVKNDKGEFAYGLGLDFVQVGNLEAYGHSGGGIGAGCELYYIPEKNLYYFLAVNLGTVTYSPLHDGIEKIRAEIYSILLQ